jgi:glycosyltransferase involved in cell wall biosynthesis
VLAGSGELDAELREAAAAHPELTVHFPGFFNQSALPRLFATCDAFALPSENEPWGLIVNEAMCASLPIIASREIGSVRDLVEDGVNGAVFDAKDVVGLADAIARVHADWTGARAMGPASLARIRDWGYARCLKGIEAAINANGR